MKLYLHNSMSIHPVFNASLLKKYYGERLLPKVVQVNDDTEYKIDLIYITRGISVIDSASFNKRGTV